MQKHGEHNFPVNVLAEADDPNGRFGRIAHNKVFSAA